MFTDHPLIIEKNTKNQTFALILYHPPDVVNGLPLMDLSLSVHRNLISAPGAFGDGLTEDSRQLKGFRFLPKSGITHPNWDL